MQFIDYTETPIGLLLVAANEVGICRVEFVEQRDVPENPSSLTSTAIQQLDEYFKGARTEFELPLDPAGTHFQKRVWHALLEIGYGQTNTYQFIANQIGNAKACRAVGAANGRNPIALVVPCHRIIGTSGKLTGYAGGLNRKQWLLALESGVETLPLAL